MTFQWLQWKYSPWGKASLAQWRFALRNSLSMCLALTLAYELNLDQPFWALTSAAVVSFPTVGGVVSKSFGRMLGSLLGATAALIIVGNALNDPWLFTFVIAGWLALCTWASNQFQNNVAYAFQLAGYTAALIVFPMVNSNDILQLWELAQSRVAEVIIGILCSGFMMLVMPGSSDAQALLSALKNMHSKLLEHANLLWRPETNDAMRTAHQNIISQILTLNLLRIQAFWTHQRFRRHNRLLNYLLHQQLRQISTISGIRRLLLNWQQPPADLRPHLETLLTLLSQPGVTKYAIARQLARFRSPAQDDYRYMAFWQRLRSFCWQYLNNSRWISHLENASPITFITPPKGAPLAQVTDNTEAIWNGLRTFCTILLISAFGIISLWQEVSTALTMAAVGCALFSSIPFPQKSLKMLLRVTLILSVAIFFIKFGLMVQINAVWQFLLIFLLPVTITLQLLRQQQLAQAGMWRLILIFSGSFMAMNNQPVFDFAEYLNGNIGKIVGVALAWLAFSILSPSSDARKGRRHIRALHRGFMDQLSQYPALSEQQFESLAYHHISQLGNSKDEHIRRWLLRWGVVLLNCSHVVWQLRIWQAQSDPLEQVRNVCITLLRDVMSSKGVQQKPLSVALQRLQHTCTALSQHPSPAGKELAAIIWRLYCALTQLEQSPITDNKHIEPKTAKPVKPVKPLS